MPFNGAAVNLLLRNMRDMAEYTVSTYTIFTMLIVYLPILLTFYTFDVYYNFTSIDWCLAVIVGFTSSSMNIVKIRSLKYEEPARLNILNYFQPIIQLFLDVIFLLKPIHITITYWCTNRFPCKFN
jgi:drug/metabolite transporter (DMT)-like permease